MAGKGVIQQLEILGKKTICFGPDLTTFIVTDLLQASKARTFVIITDRHVADLHLPDLLKALATVADVQGPVDLASKKVKIHFASSRYWNLHYSYSQFN